MRLLIDTNIFLEILLAQEQASNAMALLTEVEAHEFYISDFSLHSIGVLLFRRGHFGAFKDFLDDMVNGVGLTVISLDVTDLDTVGDNAQKFRLDFDDAYQYAVAEKLNLTIASLDKDFDRTARGRKTLADILNKVD